MLKRLDLPDLLPSSVPIPKKTPTHSFDNPFKYTDFKLIVGDRTFYVHRFILCTASPVMNAMFNVGMLETARSEAKLEDDPNIIHMILECIYYQHTSLMPEFAEMPMITWTNFQDLLVTAHKYQIELIINDCLHFAETYIDLDNFRMLFLLAEQYEFKSLSNACVEFAENNISLDNFSIIFKLANEYNLPKLAERCTTFAMKDANVAATIEELYSTPGYQQVYHNCLAMIKQNLKKGEIIHNLKDDNIEIGM